MPPFKYNDCAVRDYKNWTCNEQTTAGILTHIMKDGQYSYVDYRLDYPSNFWNRYQVPKWKWYYFYLKGKFE
jgi:hypothetical protein